MTTQKEATTSLEAQSESELERLASLLELDRQLQEKREVVAALEREAAEMEIEITNQQQAVGAARAEREARDQQRRELEARFEEEGAKMKDRRMRLNRVRNEKELSALRREIEVGKEANQLLEAEVMSALQAVDTIEATLAEHEQALAALEQKFAAQIAAHRQRIAALAAEVAAERGARDQVAGSLSKTLRAKYEQIFARRGATAVVEVRNGTCMGCHMHVPPQFFNEMKKYRDVRSCPNCHRILVWRPDSSTSSGK
ncbi:MAG: hypothetical protein HY699_09810 [Deltaproteobacteria bacterium]|nr:hypothetical protein [Deltaproteobacteria bacterium]